MMGRSIAWFVDNPRVANLLAALLILGGLLAIPNTRQETLPNVPLERIGIVSELAGTAPEAVEQLLCNPLEAAIDSVEGIAETRSEARESLCSITVEVAEGYDVQEVRDLLGSRVTTLDSLPDEASAPMVEEIVFRNRVARLILSGDLSPRDLYRKARELRARLLADPGIGKVELAGLPDREVSVEVSRQALYRYQLSFAELAAAIRQDLARVTGGLLRTDQADSLLQAGETVTDPQLYREVEVRREVDGDRLTLDQVARVTDGFVRDPMGAWLDGQPAVALDVYQVGDRNVVATANAVRQLATAATLPDNLQLLLWEDSARQYESRSRLLWSSALQGLALLVVIMGVFLGLRLAGWVGLGIPVSMLGACILLPLLDQSFNTISLFAFILVLGIVVDDAAVVGESIYERTRRLGPGRDPVIAGARWVAAPVTFAVLTTILAFVPMLFLPGPEGEFMRVIPIVAITILLLSLVESLWILPAHLHGAVARPPDPTDRWSQSVNRALERWIKAGFSPLLGRVLRYRYALLTALLGLFLLSLALLHSGWLTLVMFSKVDGEVVMADVAFPEGTSSRHVANAVRQLQQSGEGLARDLNEQYQTEVISHVYAEQGRRNTYSTAHDAGAHLRARVSLKLAPGLREPGAAHIASLWRQQQPAIERASSSRFHASLNEVKPDIHINLFHDDLATLETMSLELQKHLAGLNGIFQISNSMAADFTEIDMRPRPGAQLAGLSREELGRQVNAAFHGARVDRMPEGDREVPVVLRLPDDQSDSLWHLEQLPIELGDGEVAPLDVLATIERRATPAVIQHFDGRRSATVTAYVDEQVSSPGRVMAQLERQWLDSLATAYPGADWSVAGKPKAIRQFLDYLSVSYLLALVGMFCLLTVAFRTYWQPLVILSAIPFGLIGGFLGHAVLGYQLTLWSVVGIVAVSGVVVNDNLVLVSAINEARREDEPLSTTIVRTVGQRLRPVLLTTLTTFAGVAPLILEQSTQARFLVPMAIAVAFGVLFATVITLLLVPCLYLIGEDLRSLLSGLRARRVRASENDDVERAYQAGQQAALIWGNRRNPYRDDVLRASWEAGYGDRNTASPD